MATHQNRIVLIVDDDDGVMSIVSHTMELSGWQVISAHDGENALATWRDHGQEVDLLITDVHMPEINGCELARQIRATQPALPIIFVSGDSGSELSANMHAIANHRYLKKPFRTSELIALVASFTT
jgi:two-component system cell cycle sensor histidine kinase/response regulator CckA